MIYDQTDDVWVVSSLWLDSVPWISGPAWHQHYVDSAESSDYHSLLLLPDGQNSFPTGPDWNARLIDSPHCVHSFYVAVPSNCA